MSADGTVIIEWVFHPTIAKQGTLDTVSAGDAAELVRTGRARYADADAQAASQRAAGATAQPALGSAAVPATDSAAATPAMLTPPATSTAPATPTPAAPTTSTPDVATPTTDKDKDPKKNGNDKKPPTPTGVTPSGSGQS